MKIYAKHEYIMIKSTHYRYVYKCLLQEVMNRAKNGQFTISSDETSMYTMIPIYDIGGLETLMLKPNLCNAFFRACQRQYHITCSITNSMRRNSWMLCVSVSVKFLIMTSFNAELEELNSLESTELLEMKK